MEKEAMDLMLAKHNEDVNALKQGLMDNGDGDQKSLREQIEINEENDECRS